MKTFEMINEIHTKLGQYNAKIEFSIKTCKTYWTDKIDTYQKVCSCDI
jgi:hypothetical protein